MPEETGFSEEELEYIQELANITAKVEVEKQMKLMLIPIGVLGVIVVVLSYIIIRKRVV